MRRQPKREGTVGKRIGVFVYAADPVLQAGIAGQLRARPDIQLTEVADIDSSDVAVVAADQADEEALRTVRALQNGGSLRVVLVLSQADDASLLAAVEAGVCGILRRAGATPEALESAVKAAAAGDGTVPPDLLGRLLEQVGRLQRQVLAPRGLSFNGLTDRETEVLKLVADGRDTTEIAQRLAYSERTIKNIIRDVTMRLNLRNRTHAVAYAVKEGLI
jgi:DNA-binding NarL/FixJ family response regulator